MLPAEVAAVDGPPATGASDGLATWDADGVGAVGFGEPQALTMAIVVMRTTAVARAAVTAAS
jgi:hypothetical protein